MHNFTVLNRMDHLWLQILLRYENHSSGHIANEVAHEPDTVKFYMRRFEQLKYGTFSIQDGMYHFEFAKDAKAEIKSWGL